MTVKTELRLPCLELRHGSKRVMYSFAVDGKQLPLFSAVSRIRRDDQASVLGYQRPEVLSHIGEIRSYIESKDAMIPNAIVIAFDDRVRFVPLEISDDSIGVGFGHLVIPIGELTTGSSKPGLIVDGQQRVAAIREARVESFPIWVTAFKAENEADQREQFILVNSTKPLPKGLIYELLPETSTRLPAMLQKRRFPAHLLDRLNHDDDSPLRGIIRTPTNGDGIIKDNSIIKMIENSLSDGALYRYSQPVPKERSNRDAMLDILKSYWQAVAQVFPEAWGLTPKKSRLMHGVGIVSMGLVMDAVADRLREDGVPTSEQFKADLISLRPVCRWTNGYWELGPGQQRKWNEIQNTSRDIQMLSNYLLFEYKNRVWGRARTTNYGSSPEPSGSS